MGAGWINECDALPFLGRSLSIVGGGGGIEGIPDSDYRPFVAVFVLSFSFFHPLSLPLSFSRCPHCVANGDRSINC